MFYMVLASESSPTTAELKDYDNNMCSGLGKGAIWAQVVIMRKRGSKFNDIHINMLIKL